MTDVRGLLEDCAAHVRAESEDLERFAMLATAATAATPGETVVMKLALAYVMLRRDRIKSLLELLPGKPEANPGA